jgi:hypothetical protein
MPRKCPKDHYGLLVLVGTLTKLKQQHILKSLEATWSSTRVVFSTGYICGSVAMIALR